jgi:hypothetical protein
MRKPVLTTSREHCAAQNAAGNRVGAQTPATAGQPQANRLSRQIELAFGRLKSLIKVGEIRTRTEAETRYRLYAQ